MVLYVSGRTDIVAFYTEWFMKRYYEGYVDVRNPFNHHLISRINFDDVDFMLHLLLIKKKLNPIFL